MTSKIYSPLPKSTNPQRIMIIGCGGSGKSTLSKELAEITNLPLTHMDKEFFKPGWVEPTKEKWAHKVENLSAKDKWILEGNYSGTFPIRLSRADLVIWLDMPMPLCLWRVMKRSILNYRKTRSDMAEGCHEKISLQFFHYIFTFPWAGRKRIIRKLADSPYDFDIIQLKNKKEVRLFLNQLRK